MTHVISINIDACSIPTNDDLNRFDVTISDLIEVGPAGGNPNFTITGNDTSVINFFKNWYCEGEDITDINSDIESYLVVNP